MQADSDFVDYYSHLQVSPDCNERQLEIAYHYCAKLYHPDSGETANVDKFSEVIHAYKVLRDPEQRSQFDTRYFKEMGTPQPKDEELLSGSINEQDALDDADVHAKILLQLYKRRRENASDPGVLGWSLEESLRCSQNQFEFHIWYLRSKGFVQITEQGNIAITIEGVDSVIASSRAVKARLLIEDASDETYSSPDADLAEPSS